MTYSDPGSPTGSQAQTTAAPLPSGARWDLAFIGILIYLTIEYTRLPQMFPILQGLHVGKIVIAISVLGLLIAPRARPNGSLPFRINVALLLFLLVDFVSAWFARYPEAAWPTLIDAIKWAVVYFLVGRIVTSSWRLRIFAFLLVLLNFKLAQFAVRTYLTYGSVTQSGESVAMVGAGTTDFFGNTNDFGVAMCVVLPLAACLFYGEKKQLPRLFLLLSSGTILVAMLLSGCRGALVGACAVVLVGLVRTRQKLPLVVMGSLIVVSTVFLLPEGNRERLRSAFNWETDNTAALRVGFWKAGWRMFLDHPVVGVGPGNFGPQYRDRYYGSDPFPRLWAPHSIYIQALSESGLLGTIPMVTLWLLALRLNSQTRKHLRELGLEGNRVFEYRLALGLELSLVAYMVCGAFLTVLYYPHLWYLLGMSVGLHRLCAHPQPESRVAVPQEMEMGLASART